MDTVFSSGFNPHPFPVRRISYNFICRCTRTRILYTEQKERWLSLVCWKRHSGSFMNDQNAEIIRSWTSVHRSYSNSSATVPSQTEMESSDPEPNNDQQMDQTGSTMHVCDHEQRLPFRSMRLRELRQERSNPRSESLERHESQRRSSLQIS